MGSNGGNSRRLVLSVKPEFARKILAGEKRFEFRRRLPDVPSDEIALYSSAPCSSIIACIEVKAVFHLPVERLWEFVVNEAGMSKEKFFAYYRNLPLGYAIKLGHVKVLNTSISLARMRELRFSPPQSWRWETDEIRREVEI